MHWLLSFFHVAVHHTDVSVDNANILYRKYIHALAEVYGVLNEATTDEA